jgi:hypothetical protein
VRSALLFAFVAALSGCSLINAYDETGSGGASATSSGPGGQGGAGQGGAGQGGSGQGGSGQGGSGAGPATTSTTTTGPGSGGAGGGPTGLQCDWVNPPKYAGDLLGSQDTSKAVTLNAARLFVSPAGDTALVASAEEEPNLREFLFQPATQKFDDNASTAGPLLLLDGRAEDGNPSAFRVLWVETAVPGAGALQVGRWEFVNGALSFTGSDPELKSSANLGIAPFANRGRIYPLSAARYWFAVSGSDEMDSSRERLSVGFRRGSSLFENSDPSSPALTGSMSPTAIAPFETGAALEGNAVVFRGGGTMSVGGCTRQRSTGTALVHEACSVKPDAAFVVDAVLDGSNGANGTVRVAAATREGSNAVLKIAVLPIDGSTPSGVDNVTFDALPTALPLPASPATTLSAGRWVTPNVFAALGVVPSQPNDPSPNSLAFAVLGGDGQVLYSGVPLTVPKELAGFDPTGGVLEVAARGAFTAAGGDLVVVWQSDEANGATLTQKQLVTGVIHCE